MSAQFTVIEPSSKRLVSIMALIDMTNPEEVKSFIKSIRELAEKSKEPLTETE